MDMVKYMYDTMYIKYIYIYCGLIMHIYIINYNYILYIYRILRGRVLWLYYGFPPSMRMLSGTVKKLICKRLRQLLVTR